jgi:Family of unknown function (DUF6263)
MQFSGSAPRRASQALERCPCFRKVLSYKKGIPEAGKNSQKHRFLPGGTHMKLGRWSFALFMLAGAALLASLPALAQDEAKWEWKAFAKDAKPFYQELKTDTTQIMKVMGQEVKQNQEQTFIISWTPKPPDKDGNWVVQQKIIGVKMKIDIGGVNIAYDSTDDKQGNNPMTDFFKKLLEADLTITIDPKTMTVKKIEGHEELIKKLGATNTQMEPLLKSILSEEALKNMAEPTWGAFPLTAVKKGGNPWTKDSVLKLGPIGTYKTKTSYTYEGPDKGGEKIKVDSALTYEAPTEKAGLPFVIKKATLSSKEGTGTAIFDKAKGRFDSSTMKMKIEGTLLIEVGGMETEVALTQDQTATVKSMDENPIKGGKQK